MSKVKNALKLVVLLATVAAIFSACGGSGNSYSPSNSNSNSGNPPQTKTEAKVFSRDISGLGPVLTNSKGFTYYIFEPDNAKHVTCTAGCAAVWPPAFLKQGQKPTASGDVNKDLLGTIADPTGGKVITYNGWPLYTYVSDSNPGEAAGQALNLNGGLWYVMSPAGKIIKAQP
jgi:predicted lipoprotein with Yx(FWY)xxD motif